MSKPSAHRGGRRKRVFKITAVGKRVLTKAKDLRINLWNQLPGFAVN